MVSKARLKPTLHVFIQDGEIVATSTANLIIGEDMVIIDGKILKIMGAPSSAHTPNCFIIEHNVVKHGERG